MLVERPRVRAIVEDAVDEIRSAGVEPSVSDILWLAHLADLKCQPNRADPLDDFSLPVRCGLAHLYPITIAGDVWLRECAQKWWPHATSRHMALLAECWCLAHGKDAGALSDAFSRSNARATIMRWAIANLIVTAAEMERALILVCGGVTYEELHDAAISKPLEQTDAADYGEDVALLCAAYKHPRRHFLFDIGMNECKSLLRKAAFAFGRPDMADDADADRAFGNFRMAVREIIRRGKDGAASE